MASDDLHILEYNSSDLLVKWLILPIKGQTPGRRYGHTLVYYSPYIIIFGGNNGTLPLNDLWILSVEKAPFMWEKVNIEGKVPLPRVYHSASLCKNGSANGMIIVFGGKGSSQEVYNDIWGLKILKSGKWEWEEAHCKKETPTRRYQHCTMCIGSAFLIVGGRSSNENECTSVDLFDTDSLDWYRISDCNHYRHSIWMFGGNLNIYGGFDTTTHIPIDKIQKIEIKTFLSKHAKSCVKFLEEAESEKTSMEEKKIKIKVSEISSAKKDKSIKFSVNAVVGIDTSPILSQYGNTKKYIPITEYNSEIKKGIKLETSIPQLNSIHQIFLQHLLRPKEWIAQKTVAPKFYFRKEHIIALANECKEILALEPVMLKLKAPIKVFGDIHGQYQDLMRFFDLWGSPQEDEGDLESFDYLFLGDYVDRGSRSLETICLLMALKIRYPKQIHLLRGNHEDRYINNTFGFAEECATRLHDLISEPNSVFNAINDMYDYLPIAAVINDSIMCLHGGIGSSLHSIEQILQIKRPLEIIHEVQSPYQQLVVDILWSDPTDNDQELGVLSNQVRDPNCTGNIVKFGPDRVNEFLSKNGLSLILRGHECVMDGFERFAGGKLMTIFSATDYCGRHKNAGAALFITKSCDIIPKLIYPQNTDQKWWLDDKKRPPTPPRWVGKKDDSYN